MGKINKILSSFDLQKKLNPKIWHLQNEKFMGNPEGQKYKLNPKVREHLLEITNQFIDSFGIDVVIDDIIIRGSIASYNWSKYSDIDVHVLIDFDQFPPELRNLYSDFFYLKKVVFNDTRNIKIFGFDVELFVEHTDIEAYSDAIYSLMDNEWIKKPSKGKIEYSKEEISKEAERWMGMIDTLINNTDDEDFDSVENAFNNIKRKLRKYRLDGLKKSGELGLENLVYKVLRRNKYIDKLYSSELKRQDKKLSLREADLAAPLEKMDVGSKFGVVRPGLDTKRPHPGVDLRASSGTNLYSPGDGVVIDAAIRNDGCGGTLFIDHENGYKSRFCHLRKIDVNKGDKVKKGEKVASTGGGQGEPGHGFSTGPHLHFELYYRGTLVDPIPALSGEFEGYDTSFETELKISNEEADEIKEKIFEFNPKLKDNDKPDLIKKIKETQFIKDFEKMVQSNIKIVENNLEITKNDNVEDLQIALQYLGYLDENFGIDGFYDEKTINAVRSFKDDFDLYGNAVVSKNDLTILLYLLTYSLFDDTKLSKVKLTPNYDELRLTSMNNFYEMVLIGLDVDLTFNNLNFLRAWNDATTIGGVENPFDLSFTDNEKNKSVLQKTINELRKDYCVMYKMKMNKKTDNILDCKIFDKNNLRQKIQSYLKEEQ